LLLRCHQAALPRGRARREREGPPVAVSRELPMISPASQAAENSEYVYLLVAPSNIAGGQRGACIGAAVALARSFDACCRRRQVGPSCGREKAVKMQHNSIAILRWGAQRFGCKVDES
jgi:hypothetical protein